MNRESVDAYLRDGCGRCDRYKTPDCKVHLWSRPLVALRDIVRGSGLVEQMKWGSPCYTLDGKNVLMLTAFREHCTVAFFRGAELRDDDGLLESPGPNSKTVKRLSFRSLDEVMTRRSAIEGLVAQAIDLERTGARPRPPRDTLDLPAELASRLRADPALQRAFDALTPGRRRSHALHVAGAKQPATRVRRVDRCVPDIVAGRGFNERS